MSQNKIVDIKYSDLNTCVVSVVDKADPGDELTKEIIQDSDNIVIQFSDPDIIEAVLIAPEGGGGQGPMDIPLDVIIKDGKAKLLIKDGIYGNYADGFKASYPYKIIVIYKDAQKCEVTLGKDKSSDTGKESGIELESKLDILGGIKNGDGDMLIGGFLGKGNGSASNDNKGNGGGLRKGGKGKGGKKGRKKRGSKKVYVGSGSKEFGLAGIEEEYDSRYCKDLFECNSLLVIDAAPFLSNKSRLYRKKKSDDQDCFKKSSHGLKVGDYLKVYLENINPYLYEIEVNDEFVDLTTVVPATVSKSESGVGSDDKGPAGANSGGDVDEDMDKILKILDYERATKQLKQFIDWVQSNPFPSNKILSYNKMSIISRLHDAGLDVDENILEVYKAMSKRNQEKYITNYDVARTFGDVYFEFSRLSYNLVATMLPIQIKSYDNLKVTVTLKDKKTKAIISTQEYFLRIRGGWKVDQSFGIAAHSIRNRQFTLRNLQKQDTTFASEANGVRIKSMKNEDLDSIQSIQLTDYKSIEKGDTSNFLSLGLSTLTHFNYRFAGSFSMGPEIGFLIDFYPENDVRYLAGLGFVFNDERNRIALDVGLAFGGFKDFGAGQNFGTELRGADAMPTLIDRYSSKLFFGLSYNIMLNLKSNTTQNDN